MAGTAQVNSDKDGIFGRFLNVYDGTNFRRLLGSTSGLLLSALRPSSGYYPIQIKSVVANSTTSAALAAGTNLIDLIQVPANEIWSLYSYSYVVTSAVIARLTIYANSGGVAVPIYDITPPALNNTVVFTIPSFIDELGYLRFRVTGAAAGNTVTLACNGYAIPKT